MMLSHSYALTLIKDRSGPGHGDIKLSDHASSRCLPLTLSNLNCTLSYGSTRKQSPPANQAAGRLMKAQPCSMSILSHLSAQI